MSQIRHRYWGLRKLRKVCFRLDWESFSSWDLTHLCLFEKERMYIRSSFTEQKREKAIPMINIIILNSKSSLPVITFKLCKHLCHLCSSLSFSSLLSLMHRQLHISWAGRHSPWNFLSQRSKFLFGFSTALDTGLVLFLPLLHNERPLFSPFNLSEKRLLLVKNSWADTTFNKQKIKCYRETALRAVIAPL